MIIALLLPHRVWCESNVLPRAFPGASPCSHSDCHLVRRDINKWICHGKEILLLFLISSEEERNRVHEVFLRNLVSVFMFYEMFSVTGIGPLSYSFMAR